MISKRGFIIEVSKWAVADPTKREGKERDSGESAFAIPFKGAPCTIKAGRPKQSCEKMNGAGQTDQTALLL